MDANDATSPLSLGEMAQLGQLFADHEPRLRAMLERRMDPALAARVDAGDVLSETFLVAQRRYARFRDEGRMTAYAWLYRLALDCLIEAWRRENRGCRDVAAEMPWPDASSVQLGLGLVSPGTGPRTAAAREELAAKVRQALEMMPAGDRDVLWMRHFDGLTFAEIGVVLGVEENTANVRHLRALRRLKDLWQQLHGNEDVT